MYMHELCGTSNLIGNSNNAMLIPCHQGMVCSQVADGG
jgi:hypothetical protein